MGRGWGGWRTGMGVGGIKKRRVGFTDAMNADMWWCTSVCSVVVVQEEMLQS